MTNTANTEMRDAFNAAIDARIAEETANMKISSKKLRDFEAYKSDVAHDSVISVLVACNFNVASVKQNTYAVRKMIDLARSAANCDTASVYCNALVASAVACERAEIEITRDVVFAMCSVDAKHASPKVEKAIKSTRVQSHKSNSTVASQHNSTLNAFEALNMLTIARNASNVESFKLDRSNAAVIAIAAKLQVAL